MKTVVTGATGFVGNWLVEELLKQGDEVTIIVRNKEKVPKHWLGKVYLVEASLEQLKDLKSEEFAWEKADIFYHMAWTGTSGSERADTKMQLANVQYTCDAVRLATGLQCSRFVNAGSIMEYEAMKYIVSDSSTPGVGYIYSVAKLIADCMAKVVANQEGIGYINVIISNIYGVGEKSARFLNTIMRKMLQNAPISMTHGEQLYDFIYVEDAVRAIVLAGKKGDVNTAYYIGNSTQRPLKEFVKEMKLILESDSELKLGEIPYVGANLTYKEFDTDALSKMGFLPEVMFEEGIKRTRDWIIGVEK